MEIWWGLLAAELRLLLLALVRLYEVRRLVGKMRGLHISCEAHHSHI